jgi:DNA repair exonuclease SbcCD ATPase subunit
MAFLTTRDSIRKELEERQAKAEEEQRRQDHLAALRQERQAQEQRLAELQRAVETFGDARYLEQHVVAGKSYLVATGNFEDLVTRCEADIAEIDTEIGRAEVAVGG